MNTKQLEKKLPSQDFGILLLTTYEQEKCWAPSAVKRLLALGLLEQHPNAEPPCYRRTARGTDLVLTLAQRT